MTFRLTPIALILALAVGTLGLVGCGKQGPAPVVVGSKNFTEQEILGELIATLIEEKTDIPVERNFYLGGTMICFNGLQSGDLDLYPEYTGTGLVNILEEEVVADPDETYRRVKQAFKERYDLVWLEPFGFNNTYTLTMRKDQADKLGIQTISDLAEALEEGAELKAGFDPEFFARPDGFPALKKKYGVEFPNRPRQLEAGLMYRSCANGDVDVIDAFATDGRIAAYDLITLDDDKGFFPPYYAAPLVRADTLTKHPELRDALNALGGRIDDKTMQRLNFQVDEKQRRPADVAREFLTAEGLIGGAQDTAAD